MTAAPQHPVDVLLILTAGTHVLLALRDGTGYADGQWNLPSGKLEHGEHALDALLRETHEEIGIHLEPDEPWLTAVVHHRNTTGHTRVGLVFTAAHHPERHGEPVNAEPHKCAKVEWFSTDLLPTNTYPYTTASITAHRHGQPFTLSGW